MDRQPATSARRRPGPARAPHSTSRLGSRRSSGWASAALILALVASLAAASALRPARAIQYYGSTGAMRLNSPIVGMRATRSGTGYWLVAADGGIFAFGDAAFFGSTGAMHLNKPIVGMAATPTSGGYWLVAADGGIFSFGDAGFHGSTGNDHLSTRIVGMAATPTGAGYWMAAADGDVFGYGDATAHGGAPALSSQQPVVSILATADGGGYWITTSSGDVFAFGNAVHYGSTRGVALSQPIVGMAGPRQGGGYWLVARDGGIFSYPDRPAPTSSGAYSWMVTNSDGSPVRYNPCQTLHYVVNPSEGPAHALSDVQAAIGRVSAATGIAFAYDGTTSEFPSSNRAAFQPTAYGTRWAPILLAWERPGQTDFLTTGAVGDGGSTYVTTTNAGHSAYVTGQAAFDATRPLPDGFDDPVSWGTILLHEIGHIMGIAHVSDQTQIMYPAVHPGGPTDYGDGDRAGLRIVGAVSGCLSPPQPNATTAVTSIRSKAR